MNPQFTKFFLLFFCLLAQPVLAKSSQDSRAAAIVNNQVITYQQVVEPIKNQIYEAELKLYNLKINQLNNIMLSQLVRANPLSNGMTTDAFIDKYILKDLRVSAAEVEQFIRVNKITPDKINPTFKKKVSSYIRNKKERFLIESWLDDQSKVYGVVVNLEKPQRPRTEIPINGAPTLGNKNAPITLIEYSDFQCPYCTKAEVTIKQLQKNYPGKIKLVYKQFPLGFHKDAQKAAEASLCANEQSADYFWKLHNYMFANSKSLSSNNLTEQVGKMGADKESFSRCLNSGKYYTKVQQEIIEGQKFGVSSTPMFFVNGIVVKGAQPYEVFARIIDEELKLKKK